MRSRALLKRTPEEQLRAAATAAGGEMPRVLGRADLTLLSLGSIVGAGVFALTGVAAAAAGPSVVLAYAVAGGTALLSAYCYVELAAATPAAGGAFSYVASEFGELPALAVASALCLEYTLSVAAVARAATAYSGSLLGLAPGAGLVQLGAVTLDPFAAALVLGLAALLARGTSGSAAFNSTVTLVSLIAGVYVVAAGAPLARAANLTPFFAGGGSGLLTASSIVFFAFVGFDTVASAAEEARDPSADVPVAILASVAAAAALYAALALTLVAMTPQDAIDRGAPFAHAFARAAAAPGVGRAASVLLATSSKFVSFGALAGIVTAALVTMLGQARIYVVLGRERLLPHRLATISEATGAPVAATWLCGGTAAALALTVELASLASAVSAGTLFVFVWVAAAVLHRRHAPPGGGARAGAALGALVISSAAVSACAARGAPRAALFTALAAWAASAASFAFLPVAYKPSGFAVPGAPATPAAAVLCNAVLIGSLGARALFNLAAWLAATLALYAAYSVHAADAADAGGGRRAVAADAGGGRARDAVALELALAGAPGPVAAVRGEDRARLLTVTRLASDDGLADADPRTPAARRAGAAAPVLPPPLPRASEASEIGPPSDGGGAASSRSSLDSAAGARVTARPPSRLSQ